MARKRRGSSSNDTDTLSSLGLTEQEIASTAEGSQSLTKSQGQPPQANNNVTEAKESKTDPEGFPKPIRIETSSRGE